MSNNQAAPPDFADLFEHAPCGYVATDPQGTISIANATFCSWTGFTKEYLAGKRFQELLTLPGRIYFETHFAPLLRMQGVFNEVALDLINSAGDRLPVLVNAVERKNSAGQVEFIRISVFNAMDRRRYESELLKAKRTAEEANEALHQLNTTLEARVSAEVDQRMKAEAALRQSQKMEAIGQLTGGVAHDFNNLLTVIIGSIDSMGRVLQGLPASPETARLNRLRDMAAHGARRAATLTSRLLAFSRRQALDPKSVDPNQLIKGIAELLQRTIGENIAFEVVTGAGTWQAMADPAELENAIVNLAVNARDAMPNGGKLTIETGNAHLDDAYVEGLDEPVEPGQYVIIAVSDTGHGMDKDTLAKVFEPFFTTKEVGRGTGLGLSQVYGFLRQSRGHVRIYSEVDHGTTVKLYLPRADTELATFQPGERDTGGYYRGSECILVVEDDEALRSFSCSALRELGYAVLEASDGRSALELLDANSHVELIFTDVVLPGGLNGRQLVDEAVKLRPSLKVLFTTGYTRNAIVHNGTLDPSVTLIGKPFTLDALAKKMRQVLEA
ncbi:MULTISPECIES: PAS domain-containing hybrid sensor histidine kinase/response regulator [unclassified Bradyrhizobium]|uniref:PAS domain-containing hybrid sensor histidine kinase/response regulator n=1 Tax=unclassified Bradyrhizobium TaxID=2631580 RepID=UPI0015CB34AC|nr:MULTISPECIES: PAS domain-containing hybrid sensor histidine kinase/response regulator [unclassified Bradyrhizobium]MBB4261440.1 PAS domain S-box-containing protein [Bradyrhizobium sp. CIR3A]NYG47690.1 PAS domain S-box-containing protein [Bradyrhizobium sp. IAR9]